MTTRPRPTFTIRPHGRTFGIWSDSPAAQATDGLVVAGLSDRDCDRLAEVWEKHGLTVVDERTAR